MRLHLINEEARAIQRQQVLQHVVSLLCLLVGGLSSPDVLERLVHLLQMPIKCRAQAGAVAALQVAGSSDRETALLLRASGQIVATNQMRTREQVEGVATCDSAARYEIGSLGSAPATQLPVPLPHLPVHLQLRARPSTASQHHLPHRPCS